MKGGRPANIALIGLALLLAAAVLAFRIRYINTFAVDFPFWDQWDAEIDFLFRPWIEGTLAWQELVSAHNEHRLFFTRLLSLTWFEFNDYRYSNILSAKLNAALLTLAYCAGLIALFRRSEHMAPTLLAAVFTATLLASPLDWSNNLIGFQSQFYFLIAFTLTGLAYAASNREGSRLYVPLGVSSIAATMSMASGVLTAPALLAVCMARAWCGRLDLKTLLKVAPALLVIAAVGYYAVPNLAHHDPLRAQSIGDFARALTTVLSWPLPASPYSPFLVHAPTLGAVILLARHRKYERTDLIFFGLAAWFLLQCTAIAHSRGAELTAIPSRYMGIVLTGLAASFWFLARGVSLAWQFRSAWTGKSGTLLGAIWLCSVAIGLGAQTSLAWEAQKSFNADFRTQQRNLSLYLSGADPQALDTEPMQIPYPSSERLKNLLSSSVIRDMMPLALFSRPEVRIGPNLSLTVAPSGGRHVDGEPTALEGAAAADGAHPSLGGPSNHWGTWAGNDSNVGAIVMRIAAGCSEVYLPIVRGPGLGGLTVTIRQMENQQPLLIDSLSGESLPQSWTSMKIARPNCQALEITATDSGTNWGEWLALGEPLLQAD